MYDNILILLYRDALVSHTPDQPTAAFRFYASYEGHAVTVKGIVIEGLDLWVSKDELQRVRP